ncbi:FxsA family protein [Kushneria aurantia]|uniref:FxsA family protein n=1 Tax=Kushneria aurantia TaxID=504092 RepID=A0ABV6G7S1_9GAMM|nr:FxsA family protein [Kushneria aurantia]
MPILLPIGFFLLLDLISIFVLGQLIGAWVLLVIVIAAFIGINLVRRQGLDAFRKAQAKMTSGEFASDDLRRGAAIMLAGVLLLMPGILTDILAIFCLLPVSRSALLARFVKGNEHVQRYRPGRHQRGETFDQTTSSTREERSDGETLEGDYIEHRDDRRQ